MAESAGDRSSVEPVLLPNDSGFLFFFPLNTDYHIPLCLYLCATIHILSLLGGQSGELALM
ncbi:MAG: hypothetical protein LBR10_09655, partial [Prevotellaceae bacterium]|nr:hypothetical protein [Prevotellaceae bacterium]